jgi:uncharacterized membrane protein
VRRAGLRCDRPAVDPQRQSGKPDAHLPSPIEEAAPHGVDQLGGARQRVGRLGLTDLGPPWRVVAEPFHERLRKLCCERVGELTIVAGGDESDHDAGALGHGRWTTRSSGPDHVDSGSDHPAIPAARRGAGSQCDMSAKGARPDPTTVISWRRALIAVALGGIAGGAGALVGPLDLIPIVAWVVATLVVLGWAWRTIWPQDAAATERLAEHESRSHTTDTAVLVAAVLSLGAVILAVVESSGGGIGATAAVLLSLIGALLSWSLVNTVFALKYARAYYLDEDGGLEFNQDEPPTYSDFAYLAFTVGMTFGPAEIAPTTTSVRRTMLGHGLLSYLFGTGVLAVAINLVTNL